jgi:outer membrane protein TolC
MKYVYLFILVFSLNVTHAQVTMMNDVSPDYLSHLIAVGRANYPKFKASQARVNAAKAAYTKTKWGIFDFITLNYVYYPNNSLNVPINGGNTSFINGYQLGAFLNVGNMLMKPSTIKQAKEEYIVAQMERDASDLSLDQEIRKRYYTYVQAMNILKLQSKSVSDADDVLKNVKHRFEKGEVTFDTYNQALLAGSRYTEQKIAAESSMLIARSSLEEIIGVSLDSVSVK